MICYLLLAGALNTAAPADDAGSERFHLASANLALDRIRAAIHKLYTESAPVYMSASIHGSGDPKAEMVHSKLVSGIKADLEQLLTSLGMDQAVQMAKSEDRSFKAKLIAIALHRKGHPKLYEDLGKVYGSDEYTSELPGGAKRWDLRGVPFRLPIRKIHLDPEYRLAWEFRLLLLPGMYEINEGGSAKVGAYSAMADERPVNHSGFSYCSQPTMEGLYRTGNEKSIVTLIEFYKVACRDDTIGIAEQTVRDVFGCLEHYGTDKALVAVLDCAEWTEVQWAKRYANEKFGSFMYPGDIKPLELVTGLAKDDVKRVWLKLAEKLPTEPLSKRQKEMLAALKAEYKDRK